MRRKVRRSHCNAYMLYIFHIHKTIHWSVGMVLEFICYLICTILPKWATYIHIHNGIKWFLWFLGILTNRNHLYIRCAEPLIHLVDLLMMMFFCVCCCYHISSSSSSIYGIRHFCFLLYVFFSSLYSFKMKMKINSL